MQIWTQNYDPLGNTALSTVAAAIPVTVLFYLLAVRKTKAHLAALFALLAAMAVAAGIFRMPVTMVAGAAAHGAVYAALWIAWVVVGAVFVYDLTVESGHFETIKGSIGAITDDRRVQMLLIAFCFGAVLEGAGGGGAPVAVTAAMMIGLGFRPFETAVVCLMANTAPVAWGGMGNPVRALAAVTGLPESDLSATMGRILPPVAALLPFYLVRTMVGWRETLQVWPACLAAGLSFGGIQFFWSNFVDPNLVDIMSGMGAILFCAVFFKYWKPKEEFHFAEERGKPRAERRKYTAREVVHAWSPFALIALFVVAWGIPAVKAVIAQTSYRAPVPGLHQMVLRTAPVVEKDVLDTAVFSFDWLASVGTATVLAGLVAGPVLGLTMGTTLRVFRGTVYRMRFSFLAILCMICMAYVMRYCGMDAVLGLAMTHTGVLYPVFGTFIGWIGVALSGTDAGSNALFGNLQVVTATKLGLDPVLMAAANSTGGVMGKMVAAQSLIIACVAAGIEGKEGDLFRAVAKHGLALTLVVGLLVMLYAYVLPGVVAHNHKFW
jgi:lactate permease